jgi:hypothetical protein
MAGSILAGTYSSQVASNLTAFPEPVRGPASESLAQALAAANRLGPQGHQLVDISKRAFVEANSSAYLVLAAIVGAAALVIPVFAPGRDGEQLPVVRRLRERLTPSASQTPSTR